MKHRTILSLFTLLSSLFTLAASAAVPLHWTVETSRAVPAQFEAYQGETLALEAALQSYGKPLESPSNYSLYWQTNGMGNAWWSTNCNLTIEQSEQSNNVLRATWTPSMETGAKVYNCFIGKPGTIYHAAFQLRLRPSPGALPNELPLPQKVIDFAKVTVLNPPWSGGGGGGGVNTNAVIDIIHRTVDGSARMLPPYLHYLEMDDTYPDAAAEWYAQADYSHGSCSAVRDGNTLSRNYDWKFDFMPEFVVRIPASTVPSAPSPTGAVTSGRFASIAVCNVGTNLTEADVTSGKHSKWYKALPGHAVDGINENGVCAEINVVDGDPHFLDAWPTNGTIHCLGAVRWVLDNATNAASAATDLAAGVYFPSGFTQNFHWMIADSSETWIVENGEAHQVTNRAVMTNFTLYPAPVFGPGWERHELLLSSACCITNAWYTNAYRRETNPPWFSEFGNNYEYMNAAINAWDNGKGKESHRGETYTQTTYPFTTYTWWQTVHTSVYDITNRVLRVAVQETDDWYVFALPGATGVSPDAVREIVHPMIATATNALPTKAEVGEKRDLTDAAVWEEVGVGDDWVWTSESEELADALNSAGVKIVFRTYGDYQYWIPDKTEAGDWKVGQSASAYGRETDVTVTGIDWLKGISGDPNFEVHIATATRNSYSRQVTPARSFVHAPDTTTTGIAAFDDMGKLRAATVDDLVFGSWYFDESGLVAGDGVSSYNENAYVGGDANIDGSLYVVTHFSANDVCMQEVPVVYGISVNGGEAQHGDVDLTIPVVSATDTTFSNAVDQIVRSLMPTKLRAYDPVRQCWWNIQPVNGVLTLTVED